jgi:ketosteroid isomerase-like protein
MSQRSNDDVLRAFYAAFKLPNYLEEVRKFLHVDAVWHISGQNPLAGDIAGSDAILASMNTFGERSLNTLNLETSIMANEGHGVAIHRATASIGDLEYNTHEVDVFHINEGLITEFWSFSEDQAATDALWTSA